MKLNKLLAAGILLKPKVIIAMVLLYVTAYFCSVFGSSGLIDLQLLVDGLLAVLVSVAGANAVNCYYDRDIDAVMRRTHGRQIAIDSFGDTKTLALGTLLIFASTILSINLGIVPFTLFMIGTTFYLGIYTYLLKRRNAFNVFATFPSIASPTLLGWYLGGSPLFPVGAIIAVLVSIWGPLHLWTLSFAFARDYKSVEVPMLASQMTAKSASKVIMLTLIAQVASSYMLMLSAKTMFYTIGVSTINIVILYFGYEFYRDMTISRAYRVFKLTAPYIVAVLAIYMIDQFI
jgi:protoheme IX farnesyltransferase